MWIIPVLKKVSVGVKSVNTCSFSEDWINRTYFMRTHATEKVIS